MIKVLPRYLLRTTLATVGLVALGLLGIDTVISLIGEIRDVGKGDYSIGWSILYVLANLPQHFYSFFPLVCLIGVVIGLGILTNHFELIVMRASGVSLRRLALWLLGGLLPLILAVTTIGETIAPQLHHWAETQKIVLKSQGQALQSVHGTWVREGNYFIHVDRLLPHQKLYGVRIYEREEGLRLKRILQAVQAEHQNQTWLLKGVKETTFEPTTIRMNTYQNLALPITLSAHLLQMSKIEPVEMRLSELWKYQKEMRTAGTPVIPFEFNFWQRSFQPWSCVLMLMLAFPIVSYRYRRGALGTQLAIAILLGMALYLLNQFLGPLSIVLRIEPLFAATLPLLILTAIGLILWKRLE